ncbi:MAG TPA: hypothetical protein ENI23_13605 [bacterium]|nr:hypothetical protein [bacterium]
MEKQIIITLSQDEKLELLDLLRANRRLRDSRIISKKYLSEAEAREFLGGISKPLLLKLRKSGQVKEFPISEKRVIFSVSDLEAFVQSKEHRINEELI